MAKVTWNDIYKDFRRRHPNLAKQVCGWRPYGYAQVWIRLKNGSELVHDYDLHIANYIKFVKED